ncbi:hypothetical protein K458DRAFT_422920 [Lentithecium fluviatile CBS 122367]|uniref:AhpC-TSA-domain-containing protein n=1 Tax=Lentithecium fluviatile CBS 122367 TaxID=1168545 RepID=A0A6G1ILC9_9PLEO|nr:hypothetical protein K458DRAFT_422920 [Lentithecium fluviatile CBS 122367]
MDSDTNPVHTALPTTKLTAVQPTKPPTPPPSQSGLDKPSTTVDTIANPKLSTSTEPADTPTTPPFSPSSTTPVLPKSEDPELDFSGNIDVNDDIPTNKDLARVEDLLVLDAQGQSRPFKELYKGKGVAPRQLIIFVRHFFCGNCQEYLRELSASISPESLLALPEPTFITVIGCGRPDLIEMYTSTTKCQFPIYADPTRKLYELLGMTRTLELGKKPAYIQSNLLVTSVQAIIQGLSTGNKALKGGDFKQVGGEFLFEDGKCVWAHRMRNTRDHMEVEALRGVLGLEASKGVLRKKWSHSVKAVREKEEKERKDKEKEKEGKGWGRLRSKSKGVKDKEGSKTPELVKDESEVGAAVPATTTTTT